MLQLCLELDAKLDPHSHSVEVSLAYQKLSLMQRPTFFSKHVCGKKCQGGDFGFKFFTDGLFAGGICSWFCFVMTLLL